MKFLIATVFFLILSTANATNCTTHVYTGPDGRTIVCITCCTNGQFCSTSCS